jgi:hypothetical protein
MRTSRLRPKSLRICIVGTYCVRALATHSCTPTACANPGQPAAETIARTYKVHLPAAAGIYGFILHNQFLCQVLSKYGSRFKVREHSRMTSRQPEHIDVRYNCVRAYPSTLHANLLDDEAHSGRRGRHRRSYDFTYTRCGKQFVQ